MTKAKAKTIACATCDQAFHSYGRMQIYCSELCHITPKIDQRGADECWPWTGHLSHEYAAIERDGVRYQVTHLVLKNWKNETVEKGFFACHTCDNPPCCNPNHLWIGTSAENNADMGDKGRRRTVTRSGSGNPNARLSDDDLADILAQPKRYGLNKELAVKYGVHKAHICRLRLGYKWADHKSLGKTGADKNRSAASGRL